MDDLPDLSRLDSMNALEKLRLLTEIAVREKKAAAFGLRNGDLVWEGAPTECLMAERPVSDDEFDEDLDEDDEGRDTGTVAERLVVRGADRAGRHYGDVAHLRVRNGAEAVIHRPAR